MKVMVPHQIAGMMFEAAIPIEYDCHHMRIVVFDDDHVIITAPDLVPLRLDRRSGEFRPLEPKEIAALGED